MFDPTTTIKRLGAALVAVTALAVTVPVAQSYDGPPDAIDRYNAPASTWDGPPDAIDRYRASQEAAQLAVARPGFNGPPDAIDRYLGRTTTAAPVVALDDGFAWSEFGIGAGAMLGLVLLAAGLGLGALAVRHRSGTLRTS
jgi:hypothetical protein